MMKLNSERPTPIQCKDKNINGAQFNHTAPYSVEDDLLSSKSQRIRQRSIFLSNTGYVYNTKSFYPYNAHAIGPEIGRGSGAPLATTPCARATS